GTVWTEPDNENAGSYPKQELKDKAARVTALLPLTFEWARETNPQQPLTSGVWGSLETSPDGASLSELQQIQLRESDIVTFHNYTGPEYCKRQVAWLKRSNRPVSCTARRARWVART